MRMAERQDFLLTRWGLVSFLLSLHGYSGEGRDRMNGVHLQGFVKRVKADYGQKSLFLTSWVLCK